MDGRAVRSEELHGRKWCHFGTESVIGKTHSVGYPIQMLLCRRANLYQSSHVDRVRPPLTIDRSEFSCDGCPADFDRSCGQVKLARDRAEISIVIPEIFLEVDGIWIRGVFPAFARNNNWIFVEKETEISVKTKSNSAEGVELAF